MSSRERFDTRVKLARQARGWTQADLADAAGLSRTGVSAIEAQRLTPSVAAALAISRALESTVEQLFGMPESHEQSPQWAWPPAALPCRYWAAETYGRERLYPVEGGASGAALHDGVAREGATVFPSGFAVRTLVVPCCDPAAGLLATLYERLTGFRMLVFPRSSRMAIDLLAEDLVHVAGVHLSRAEEKQGNASALSDLRLAQSLAVLHVANWQEGIALSAGATFRSAAQAVRANLRWVGRQSGAGARRCQDELLGSRAAPRRTARDHIGVVEAISSGWAEAGVCVRMASEEARLGFIPVCEDNYDLCFRSDQAKDPRILALVGVIRSGEYRRLMDDLPGYRPQNLGELEHVSAG